MKKSERSSGAPSQPTTGATPSAAGGAPIDNDQADTIWYAIRERIADHLPPSNPIRRRFEATRPENDSPKHTKERLEAIALFCGLPLDLQRRILNGWHPKPAVPSIREALEGMANASIVQRVVHVEPGGLLHSEWEPDDRTNAAAIRVRAYASKHDVLAAIDRCRELVDELWDQLIQLDPDAEGRGKSFLIVGVGPHA